jgi:hypothetical protein
LVGIGALQGINLSGHCLQGSSMAASSGSAV